MARLTGPAGIGGRRTAALGPAYRVSYWRGIPRVYAKSPTKRKKISPRQKQAMDDFRALAMVAKYACSADLESAKLLSAGTQFLWRDLIYMAAAGRIGYFTMPDGSKVFSVAARTSTSEILDSISQVPGSMLYRGPGWWEEIPIGPEGWVLTSQGPDLPPVWQLPEPGGSGLSVATQVPNTTETGAGATFITFYNPAIDVEIAAAQIAMDWINAGQYIVRLVTRAAGIITAVLATTATYTQVGASLSLTWFNFPVPVTFLAGQEFGIAITRTNVLGTASARPRSWIHGPQNFPNASEPEAMRISSNGALIGLGGTGLGGARPCLLPAWRPA